MLTIGKRSISLERARVFHRRVLGFLRSREIIKITETVYRAEHLSFEDAKEIWLPK